MIPTILGSLTFLRRRGVMEVVSPTWRKLWKEWELRLMVLLSLIFQITLIFFGNRRKYNPKIWIKIVLWSAYLMADSVATIALGVLSNDLGDRYGHDCDHGSSSLDPNNELTAFWAPFLLLHLGGPDTITAYALEDNELWLRHTFGLVAQTSVTIYIFLMAWTGSLVSILAVFMILVGFFKYAERTWVLWLASSEELRDSMLTSPEPGPNYAKFMDEFSLKQAEGFYVRTEDVIEVQDSVLEVVSVTDQVSIPDVNELRRASKLLKRFKLLFVDLILSFHDRNISQSLFKGMSSREAFKVIEIELGFMYDLFYTKAKVAYTPMGFLRRLVCLSVTCVVLLLFSLAEKHKYNMVDIVVTFLLLVFAIGLEIYALLILLTSDQTHLWLSKHNRTSTFQTITLKLPKQPRWSNSIAQYSLLNVCLKEKPAAFFKIQKLLRIDEKLEKVRYTTYEKVSEPLRELIFNHIKEKFEELQKSSTNEDVVRGFCTYKGGRVLEKFNCLQLDWSTNEDYDQTILIWHIATELCYYSDCSSIVPGSIINYSNCTMSKDMSRYVLYLLVRYPFLLPVGIGLIRFRDTCAEAMRFFEKRRSTLARDRRNYKSQACKMLLEVNTQIPPKKVKGDGSKSVLFDACRLASELNKLTDVNKKWDMLSEIWVEILAYAANQCRGNPHAQQLRRGGELLTHVWLLMAHFGITEQFQISEGHARAKLIVN